MEEIKLRLYNEQDEHDKSNTTQQYGMIPVYMFDTLDISSLEQSVQNEIMEVKSTLDIDSPESILSFGSKASEEMSAFTTNMLKNFSSRDIPNIDELIPVMEGAFNRLRGDELIQKQKGIMKWLKPTTSVTVQEFMRRYNDASEVVADVKNKLDRIDYELLKDIEMDKQFGLTVIDMIKQLEYHILAAKIALRDAKNQQSSGKYAQETYSISGFLDSERKHNIDRLERKIYNLGIQRLEAIQTLPIIQELISGNIGLSEQIKVAISQGIPTWEKGILISIHLYRQQSALQTEQALREMTNNIIRHNAEMMKSNIINIAQAIDEGMIDIKALQDANETILSTAKELDNVIQLGRKARIEQTNKLKSIEAGSMIGIEKGSSKV